MPVKTFIDGAAGTTGLEIRERLASRRDLAVSVLAGEQRKNKAAREEALNDADIVILCLPDDAARESLALISNNSVRVIDASTAHRTAPGWVYGFPELAKGQREKIRRGARISNPGCYATGFVALVRPLVDAGIVPMDWPVNCSAVSGYSGGGRGMIAEFEDANAENFTEEVFRTYGLSLAHKHVPEMQLHSGLTHLPVFSPSVGRFYRGMITDIPLPLWALPSKPNVARVHAALAEHYEGEPLVEVASLLQAAEMKTLDAEALKNTDRMKIFVFGNEARRQVRVIAVLDNLGKGAAGAAVQNLNIMIGAKESEGLE
ncbi:MAG: N-acetyl-gamma-glutamyl-phosphate reductase [Alphaproteobacteria bacterium]